MRPATVLVPLSLCLFGILLIPPPVAADDYSVTPERFSSCITCHGVEFRGNQSVDAPRLNGMEDWYLRSQMLAFKQGWRGTHTLDLIGMEMQPQASALSEQAIDDVVNLVASTPLRIETIEHQISGDKVRGETLYRSCAACHGPAGQGSKVMNAPRLAGQSDWYLVRQLKNYTTGSRGYVAADSAGAQMQAATSVLDGSADILDVVAYINTLSVD